MDDIKLMNEPLNVGDIYNKVGSPDCGAISLFVGTTRDSFLDKPVLRLEYEAYESMALKSLESLAGAIREKFKVRNIAIYHRLGEVPVGEASVVIAIASPHRQASLEAVSFAIDSLKANVPIFKKELYADDGSSNWKANTELDLVCEELAPPEEQNMEVDAELVQITASAQEINRRIESFQRRKRRELDEQNVREFCSLGAETEESTCARVNPTLMRQTGSKSHLKVHRVENDVGPQLLDDEAPKINFNLETGVAERLSNAERFLGITNGRHDVYTRLKNIEDRILFLESVSPEYFPEMNAGGSGATPKTTSETKKSFSAAELGKKVSDLERKLQVKFVT